jgi:hypothetical protein
MPEEELEGAGIFFSLDPVAFDSSLGPMPHHPLQVAAGLPSPRYCVVDNPWLALVNPGIQATPASGQRAVSLGLQPRMLRLAVIPNIKIKFKFTQAMRCPPSLRGGEMERLLFLCDYLLKEWSMGTEVNAISLEVRKHGDTGT